VYFFSASLRLCGDIRLFGGAWGGLAGFVAVLPMALTLRPSEVPLLAALLSLIVGPGLTTILGQIGGAWGARRSMPVLTNSAYERAVLLASVERPSDAPSVRRISLDEGNEGQTARLQFGIRHLLWITVWLSLLLTVIRLFGFPMRTFCRCWPFGCLTRRRRCMPGFGS
jgi:hypothetical protein